jgi:hypothetical protein
LLKDAQECFRIEIEDVPIPPADDFGMVPIVKRLTLVKIWRPEIM